MKKLILFGLLNCILLVGQSKEVYQKTSKIILKAVFKGVYYANESGDSNCTEIYYLVDIKLINNTQNPFDFFCFTCCASRVILTDNKDLNTCYNFCVSDSPFNVALKPKQEFSFPALFRSKGRIDKDVRIGIVFVTSRNATISNFSRMLEGYIENQENTIWSDPINLRTIYGPVFEVKEKELKNLYNY
jgi:hypothetical protein